MTLLHSATLVVLFEAQVQQTPDRIALIEGDRQFTYQELNAKANQLAHALKQCDWANHTNLVAIALDRSCEFVIAVLGVLKAGFAYIPLDRSLPENRILHILSEARSPLLTTQAFAGVELPVPSFHLDRAQPLIQRQSTANPVSCVQPSDLAYVIYTSGSTGVPKGVMIEHRSAAHYAVTAAAAYGLTPIDRVLQCCSLSFDAVIEELFCTFAIGATLIIRSEDMLSTAAFFLSECQRLQISALFVPTALWHFLATAVVEEALELPKTLHLISVGGERARPELFQRWRDRVGNSIRLINSYGPTEATVVATMSDLSQLEAIEGELPIGVPIAGVEAYVLDADLNPVAPFQVGELYLGGVGIARGYLNQPQLTQERFILNPFDNCTRLYRTGDRVRMRSDQQLEYVGRIDHQVKVAGGFRVELFEIEAQIAQHPSVDQAVVIAADQGQGEKCLIAYVVFQSIVFEETVALAELRSFLKQQLPAYMIPVRFVPLDALPLSPIGKVDRQKLAAQSVATEIAPSTRSNSSIAAQIANIFQGLLQQSIGLDDNFFDWGGTSLLAAQALAQITRTWQVSVWMRQFYQSPTPAALAQIVLAAQQGKPSLNESIDFEAEAQFSLEVDRAKPVLSVAAAQTILLTGATGFLGAFLLHELLQTTTATIVCLVRCRDATAGQARLQSILTQYHLWNPADRDRIQILPGDLAQPRLGLSEAAFLQLADRVEAIYHSGAIVDFIKPYSLLKAANVLGTAEILRLASSGTAIKPLIYISTIGVFGAAGYFTGNTVIHEQTPLSVSKPFIGLDDGYAQSKWVAERMVQQAQQKLPIAIVRPGFIFGHSQTGAANHKDYISRLIKGCIELGCVSPIFGQKDQMVTVDYVARAIVYLSKSSQHIGKIFHLTPPPGRDINTHQLYRLLGKFGYSLDWVSYSEWTQRLASSPTNSLYPLLPLFSEPVYQGKSLIELYEHCPDYDCCTTQAALAAIEMTFSSIEPVLLKTYLPAWIRSGFLTPPEKVELSTVQPRLLTSATAPEH
ncbi:amino acid adenylation domain-containing protein [Microcoleus sp. FACHB-1515]|uniref:non-ribosomal peptide synthetase family protein n=1 Tax=Cyanophyceae TaxID=3028117 RepID=UPI0016828C7E|nr:non-ribosomal peptide synthetase [Microcoleus sp. FACHB-1515]MBD2092037.1 amino acid adenylation domain-containing protein [Microcoleus sp. FACHB-1515]